MYTVVDLVDDLVDGVEESRKLLHHPDSRQIKRRAVRFPEVVVPSAVRQGMIYNDRAEPEHSRDVAKLGHFIGLHRAARHNAQAVADYAAGHEDIHPEIQRQAEAMHRDVVRRGVKAGIFKRVPHPDPKVKEKMLVAGERAHVPHKLADMDMLTAHDAIDHGVTGADASWVGEVKALHMNQLHKAVTAPGTHESRHAKVKEVQGRLPSLVSAYYGHAGDPYRE